VPGPALPVKTVDAKPIFRVLFREVALNVWWMQLGIVHQRITPASPQENGTHERRHRELKRETARPAASSLAEPQVPRVTHTR